MSDAIRLRSGWRGGLLALLLLAGSASAVSGQTPEAGGPTARETLALLRALSDIDLVGCDVVEVNPLFDGPSQITALLAATVMAELMALKASATPG